LIGSVTRTSEAASQSIGSRKVKIVPTHFIVSLTPVLFKRSIRARRVAAIRNRDALRETYSSPRSGAYYKTQSRL
jgi:hypothetical protein